MTIEEDFAAISNALATGQHSAAKNEARRALARVAIAYRLLWNAAGKTPGFELGTSVTHLDTGRQPAPYIPPMHNFRPELTSDMRRSTNCAHHARAVGEPCDVCGYVKAGFDLDSGASPEEMQRRTERAVEALRQLDSGEGVFDVAAIGNLPPERSTRTSDHGLLPDGNVNPALVDAAIEELAALGFASVTAVPGPALCFFCGAAIAPSACFAACGACSKLFLRG
jgi:hypothetical protein